MRRKLALMVLGANAAIFAGTALSGVTFIPGGTSSLGSYTMVVDSAGTKALHTWKGVGSAYSAWLTDSGSVIYSGGSGTGPGAPYKTIYEVRWADSSTSNTPVHSWTWTSPTSGTLHHAMNYMPNGHWLALGYEYLTNAQLKRKLDSNGVASSGVTYTGAIYNEHILEYDPVAAKVVWDWSAANHMSTSTDIRKIDVNKFSSGSSGPGGGGGSSGDLIHLNSVAYDPEHDLIVVSAHMMDEVFVVDHSVTDTKSSTGGTYKHGGDILFRWGNASNYGGGSSAVFNVVHGANFVPSGYANAGNILAFSNNDNGVYVSGAKGYSMSYEIQPTLEDTGFLIAGSGEFASSVAFDYYNTATKYQSTSDFGFVQRLSNGNTFISFSQGNTLAEVDAGGTIVQEYDNCSNSQVRASRFPYCYEGVSRLAAYASHNCSGASSLKDASGGDVFSMRTSHEDRTLNLRGLDAGTLVRVVDLQGRVRAERTSTATEMAIPMRGWSNGTYLVQLTRDGKTSTKGLGILF